MKPLLPFSRALLTWLHKNHFFAHNSSGLHFALRYAGWHDSESASKNTSKLILKYPKYSSIRIFENSLGSDLVFVCCGKSLGSKLEIAYWLGYDSGLVKIWGRVCAILSWLVTSCAIITFGAAHCAQDSAFLWTEWYQYETHGFILIYLAHVPCMHARLLLCSESRERKW